MTTYSFKLLEDKLGSIQGNRQMEILEKIFVVQNFGKIFVM